MTSQKIIMLVISILLIIAVIGGVIYYLKVSELEERNMELINEIGNKIPIEKIDSTTIRKTGLGITDKEMEQYIKNNVPKVLEILKLRNQEPEKIIITKIIYQYDSIKIKGDSVFINNGIEYGSGEKKDKWFYIQADWTCNPYLLNVNKIQFQDRIITIPYKNNETKEEGVYITNENPHASIDTLLYMFDRTIDEGTRIKISAGIITDKKLDTKILFSGLKINKHGILVGTDLKKLMQTGGKWTWDDFKFGYEYTF